MWKRLRSFLATPPTQLSSAVRKSRNRGSILEKIYRIAELPSSSAAFNALPIVRGYVDAIRPLPDGTVNVSGWLLLPDRPLDQIDVYLDGIRVTSAPLTESQEIADLFKWIPHANHSVFNFIVPLTEKQSAGTSILEFRTLQRHAGWTPFELRPPRYDRFLVPQKITPFASRIPVINVSSRSVASSVLESSWRQLADTAISQPSSAFRLGFGLRSGHCSPNVHTRWPRSPWLRHRPLCNRVVQPTPPGGRICCAWSSATGVLCKRSFLTWSFHSPFSPISRAMFSENGSKKCTDCSHPVGYSLRRSTESSYYLAKGARGIAFPPSGHRRLRRG